MGQQMTIETQESNLAAYHELLESRPRTRLHRLGLQRGRRRRRRVRLGWPVARRRRVSELRRGRRLRQHDGRGFGALGPRREDLHDLDVPEHPVLRGGAVGHVVRDGVPPRREPPVGAEEVSIPCLEARLEPVPHGLPLHRRVRARGRRLQHLPPRHAEQEGLVGGGEVAAVAAPEADGAAVRHGLDGPPRVRGRAVAVLRDVHLVLVRVQELVVVALEPHHFGPREQLHRRRVSPPGAGVPWGIDLSRRRGREGGEVGVGGVGIGMGVEVMTGDEDDGCVAC
ncbi:unnamed protein product [Urochloa decumbens]|uniref:Uncharacterized protein n=1 Tax=Urochloa decumbens TaxID=240449 RepID=A0ABC8XN79_9POAL